MQETTKTIHERSTELFPLGQVVATPGALAALTQAGDEANALLERHARGDWGEVDPHDRNANNHALRYRAGPSSCLRRSSWRIAFPWRDIALP